MKATVESPPELVRGLGVTEAITLIVGSIIGSGIFLVPSLIAAELRSPALVFVLWGVAGVLSLFGALSYAELGALLPKAGGQYVYLREAYGPVWAFLYGWTEFLVIRAGSLAAVATAFALYAGHFRALSPAGVKLVAIFCILGLVLINTFGVRLGGQVQNVFTALKVAALGVLIVGALSFRGGSMGNFAPMGVQDLGPSGVSAFGVAMVSALWAYDGWNNVNFVAEEIRDPQRNIPRALAIAMAIVMALYLLANAAYLYVCPLPVVAQSKLVAADTAKRLVGPGGASLVSAAVMLSAFGTLNGSILSAPRVYYAMARDGLFFRPFAGVHRKYRTPAFAIVFQGAWASVIALSGRYDQLLTYVIFAAWIFYAMTAGAVLVLRRRLPEAPRPYKTWGYPVVPLIFVAIAVGFVVNTLLRDPRDSLMGLMLVVLGLPAFGYWNRKRRAVTH